jgi:hypothetical protein
MVSAGGASDRDGRSALAYAAPGRRPAGPRRSRVAAGHLWRGPRRCCLRAVARGAVDRAGLGPSVRAPAVLADSGEPVELADQHLGRQTTLNPGCLDAPPLRAAVDGFVWGYCMPPVARKSGWMRLSDLKRDPAFEQLACRPAGADFDRRPPRLCGGHCDGRPLTGVQAATGTAVVTAREVYLRYAPGSTAFRYLVRGDAVRRISEPELERRRGPNGALDQTRHARLGADQHAQPVREQERNPRAGRHAARAASEQTAGERERPSAVHPEAAVVRSDRPPTQSGELRLRRAADELAGRISKPFIRPGNRGAAN